MNRQRLAQSLTRPLPPVSATETAQTSDRIDALAAGVLGLPAGPYTVGQRDRLRIIARELGRRAEA